MCLCVFFPFHISSPTPFGSDLRSPSSHKFDVAHLEDSRQQLEHVSDLLLSEFHHFQGLLHRRTQAKSGNMSQHGHKQHPGLNRDMTVIISHLFFPRSYKTHVWREFKMCLWRQHVIVVFQTPCHPRPLSWLMFPWSSWALCKAELQTRERDKWRPLGFKTRQ